jgi:two-component system chemotaxis sensor kinase CheA
MDDLIQEFLAETNESLAALDLDIVKLEQNPNDKDLIGRIFRLVHTIKGTCGFLGLPRLEKLAHHAENVLGRYRDGSLAVTPQSVSLILTSFDRIKTIVAGLEAAGAEPAGNDTDLIEELDAVYEGRAVPAEAPAPAPAAETPKPAASLMEPDEFGFVPVPVDADFVPAAVGAASAAPLAAPAASAPVVAKPAAAAPAPEEAAKSLRVSVEVLENLMTMVSELVLTRNQLLQIMRQQPDSAFSTPLQRLNHVVSELQEGVMQTRMQPISNAWGKLPRIVRDISVEVGKKINLEMRGAETELDRQVLDLIKDPLTHMVRNSADHGIEIPSDRAMAGKPEEGTILLNAFHEGGHIIIEISDDGKGLDTEKIRAKAIEKGVISEEQSRLMTEQQMQQLIFAAGFSTAEKVTAISGRGVGMDVVRNNIEKIGGTIEMRSVLGRGTTFTIKIPLTLAIVSALIIEVAGERYAVPQLSVRELVRLSNGSEARLEDIHGTPIMRLRDSLLPLVSLRKILNLGEDEAEQAKARQVIVAQVGAYQFGIIVDRVFDTEEIVVKPVSPILRSLRIFSGNTILGDGSVIMILDPNGVASAVGDVSSMAKAQADIDLVQTDNARKTPLLVFRAGRGAPRAVPLSLVSRLEEINVDKIERSGNRSVVQYRGKLMPLIPFSDTMELKTKGNQSVLVFSERERVMGLMVDEIIDIVEEHIDVQLTTENAFGLLGSAIIHGQAMDVIDVGHFLSIAHADWFGSRGPMQTAGAAENGRRVLLVDDSPFFRNMLAPMLHAAGYEVKAVNDAAEALKLSQGDARFDLIISDIEMPGMNGFDFAKAVRAQDGKWSKTPLLALSSHATSQDLERGRAAGFDDYIAKFDRDALLRAVEKISTMSKDVA